MPHGGLPAGQYIAAAAIDTDVHTRTRRTTYQDGPVKMTTGHRLDGLLDGAVGGSFSCLTESCEIELQPRDRGDSFITDVP